MQKYVKLFIMIFGLNYIPNVVLMVVIKVEIS